MSPKSFSVLFILTLFVLNFSLKFLYNLSSMKVYLFIIFLQILMIFIQMIINLLLFEIDFNYKYLFEIILLTLALSYPIFLFFSRLDKFN